MPLTNATRVVRTILRLELDFEFWVFAHVLSLALVIRNVLLQSKDQYVKIGSNRNDVCGITKVYSVGKCIANWRNYDQYDKTKNASGAFRLKWIRIKKICGFEYFRHCVQRSRGLSFVVLDIVPKRSIYRSINICGVYIYTEYIYIEPKKVRYFDNDNDKR